MTALFCQPYSFSVVSANEATNSPATNLNLDTPTYVWKSSNLTTVNIIIDLGTTNAALGYDTVGLVGTNLRSTDTIRIRTGTTSTGIGSYDSGASGFAAHGQTVPTGATAKTIHRIGATRTERYMRIDITATSHPDTWVRMQRLVVGKAITTIGVAADAERFVVDQSIQYEGPGWESFEDYPRLDGWKVTAAWISDADARDYWHKMLMEVGRSKGILFCPRLEDAKWVTDCIFGRIQSERTTFKQLFADSWNLELQMVALAS